MLSLLTVVCSDAKWRQCRPSLGTSRSGFHTYALWYRTWMWRGMVCRVRRPLYSLTRPWLWRTRPSEPSQRLRWTSWLENTWRPRDRTCQRETWTPLWPTRLILLYLNDGGDNPTVFIGCHTEDGSNKSSSISFTVLQCDDWLNSNALSECSHSVIPPSCWWREPQPPL